MTQQEVNSSRLSHGVKITQRFVEITFGSGSSFGLFCRSFTSGQKLSLDPIVSGLFVVPTRTGLVDQLVSKGVSLAAKFRLQSSGEML